MAKPIAKNPKKSGSTSAKKKKSSVNIYRILIIGAMSLALIGLVLPNLMQLFRGGSERGAYPISSNEIQNKTMPEPTFQKEGELSFISGESGEALARIEIEKATDERERQFGLMFRRSMDEFQGMLFLFEESEARSFWMENTYIPLDIMFVDENNTILNIHHNATPLSKQSLHSKGKAKYAVEVNGGFSERHQIKAGDKINWN